MPSCRGDCVCRRHSTRSGDRRPAPETPAELFDLLSRLLPWCTGLILGVAVAIESLIATGETGKWELILRFIYQVPYGQDDPLFGKDIGFYLFLLLPVYVVLKNWMLWVLLLSIAVAGVVYPCTAQSIWTARTWRISSAAITHGSALLGGFFAIKAWSYAYLDRFLLLYNDNGIAVGAAYTDTHVELPGIWLLICLAGVAGVVAWVNVRLRTYRLPIAATALVFGSSSRFRRAGP